MTIYLVMEKTPTVDGGGSDVVVAAFDESNSARIVCQFLAERGTPTDRTWRVETARLIQTLPSGSAPE